MKRKLVKQGVATMMISLPSKWVKEHHLEKGDEIELERIDNNLLISSKTVNKKTETELKLERTDESEIRTLITNAYRAGCDRVKVDFGDEKRFRQLNKIIKSNLIGFDIIKKEKDFCIVENITEPSENQFDNILKKMFLSISELLEITEKRLTGSKEDYEEVEERIQKYDNFCRRVISKNRVLGKKSEFFWTFLSMLMHGQREIYFLNEKLEQKTSISDKTKNLLGDVQELFSLISNVYLKKDIKLLSKVRELHKDAVYKKGQTLLQSKKGKENLILYHMIIAMRQFYHANSPLFGLILK